MNKTDSAVRLTHIPTGIVAACQTERSQHKNRATAMKMLKARIYEKREDEKRSELEKVYGEKGEIGWGNQIRSYVLQPYQMVKDLRTNFETSDTKGVLDGDLDAFARKAIAQEVRDELMQLPEVNKVIYFGDRPYEISVEVSEQTLRKYGLTMSEVSQAIKSSSIDLPGGTIKTGSGEILVRTKERRYIGDEYASIVILTTVDGTEVTLGDIATIKDGFEETDQFGLFDGQPAAMAKVYRVADQKPTEISAAVKRYVEAKRQQLPESVGLATWNDNSELFKSRKDLLTRNALLGLVLVFITLGLFLEIRLALWVMLGIPISFCGALFFMPAIGVSINMISLFAFIMALGIVVDDAIVVGENVYEQRQSGKPYLQAAIDGATEVAQPVVFAILTSVTAFLPLLFTSGIMGKFILVIPAIVITVLLVSLVECLFILPAHLAIGQRVKAHGRFLAKLESNRQRFGRLLQRFIDGPYQKHLTLCLEYRYMTVAVAVAILLLAGVGLVGGGIVKFRFMPEVDADVIQVALELAPGSPVTLTEKIQDQIVKAGLEVVAEYDEAQPAGVSVMRHVFANVGTAVADRGPAGAFASSGGNIASISMFLTPSEQRGVPASEIARHWRERVGAIAGVETLTFTSTLIHLGANIDVQLAHNDFVVLDEAAERLKEIIATYPGTGDITDNYTLGKREVKAHLKPEARTLGITEEDLGRQLRGAFYGAEALRLQRDLDLDWVAVAMLVDLLGDEARRIAWGRLRGSRVAAAAARVCTSSLLKTAFRWRLTVLVVIKSRSAISL